MIKYLSVVLLLAVSMLLFNSCEKIPGHLTGTTASSTSTSGSGSMAFSLDGTAKTASSTVGIYVTSQSMLQVDGYIGAITNGEMLGITIINPAVGTFPITANNTLCVYNPSTTGDSYIGATGTVVITTFTSTTVAGTFSFTGSTFSNTTKAITNGTFSMSYNKQ